MQRRRTFPTEVFLDPVEVFDRDEEAIRFGVLELEVFAMRAVGLEQTHAFETCDSVVDVYHQLIWREVERELPCQVLGPGACDATAT